MRGYRIAFRIAAAATLVGLAGAPGLVDAAEPLYDTWRGFSLGSVNDAQYPSDGKSADFNNDGLPDLAVVHYWQRPKLTISFNQGDGTLGEPTHYPAQVSQYLETGDFNGDGHEDIVISDYGDAGQLSTISFYFNNGDGTFGGPQTQFVGRRPREIVARDFDGDGDLDVAVAAIGTTNNPILDVSVLYNDGTGTFSGPVRFLGGDQSVFWFELRPWNITSGDLNSDGYPDLIVGHAYQACSVLLNDGAGGFLPPATQMVESGPWGIDNESGVLLLDADHDDDLDIVFSCIYMVVYEEGDPGAVALFRNQGDGTMDPAEVIPLMSSSTGSANLEAADVTGDGWDDVIICWEGGGELCWGVLEADGVGGFGQTTRYAGGDSPTAICPVDVDLDGHIDVVAPSRGSLMASIHLNPGNGDFATPPHYPIGGFKQRHFDAGDLDNDGDLDIAFCGGGYGYDGWIQILRNLGDGRFASPEWYDVPNVGRSIKIRDMDGDGWNDLVWADDPGGPPYDFKTMMNRGDGTFRPYWNWQVGTCGTRDLQAIDLDNDGDLDVVLGEYLTCFGYLDSYIYIRLNNGDGTFAPTYLLEGDKQGASGITSGDFNEDGLVDLAVTNPFGVVIYPGNGDGTFGEHTLIPMESGKIEIMCARFNEDEHDDLVVQGTYMRILLGRGDGTFEPTVEYEVDPAATTALEIGDADADGDIDVILGNWYSHDASIFLNRGDGFFDKHERYGSAGKVADVLLRDFTGDQVPDLAFAGSMDHFPFGDYGIMVVPGLGLAPADVPGSVGNPSTQAQLNAARPNPFTSGTTLSYSIPRETRVELAVFDINGRLVKRLVDEGQVGPQVVTWDASDRDGRRVSAGIYYARLRYDGQESTRSVTVVR